MKINKLAYMLCLALAVGSASCSTDKEWEKDMNSAASTKVEFSAAEFSVKENKGVVQLPIVCSDDQNGRVTVTLSVEPVSATGAVAAEEGVNYIVTSKKVNIDAEDKEAYFEFKTVDDTEINDPRMFKVTITSAKGATVGEKSSCIVTIKDNDAAFYEKLMGNWTMASLDSDGEAQSWDVQITGADEGEEGYDETLYIMGINGRSSAQAELEYNFDKVTKTGFLKLNYGTFCAASLNFGSSIGVCDIYIGGVNGRYIDLNGSTTATWSDDFNTITFEKDVTVYGFLIQNGQPNGYNWFSWKNAVLTRK